MFGSIQVQSAEPRFIIKMSTYHWRNFHCGDETIFRLSYLYNGISSTDKTTSLYWIYSFNFIPGNSRDGDWLWCPIFPMMTSTNGNIFRVTGPLCREFTGHRWIPLTVKASGAELWCFLWFAPWINGWESNREARYLRRHRAHYDVIVMPISTVKINLKLHSFSEPSPSQILWTSHYWTSAASPRAEVPSRPYTHFVMSLPLGLFHLLDVSPLRTLFRQMALQARERGRQRKSPIGLDWICLKTTHVLQDILAVLHKWMSQNCFHSLNNYSSPIILSSLGASWS